MHPLNAQEEFLRLQEVMRHILQGYDRPPVENTLLTVTDYALARSGKMLRGRMLLEACRAVSGDGERALFAAAAIEYLHLGTLIHDDIIDQDPLRRGNPSVWKRFGPDLALLSGDFLYFAAYQFLARSLLESECSAAAQVLKLFSTACMDLCLGQALEERLVGIPASTDYDAVLSLYLEVVRLKTASLFRAAVQIGILLGGGNSEQVEGLGRYAQALGIAFQMRDDLLPFTRSAEELGKPVTSDIKNRRLTAPILFALINTDEEGRQLLSALYDQNLSDDELIHVHAQIREICEHTAALEHVRASAESYLQEANAALLCLPDTDARDVLRTIANQLA